jgi:hypothetical protein
VRGIHIKSDGTQYVLPVLVSADGGTASQWFNWCSGHIDSFHCSHFALFLLKHYGALRPGKLPASFEIAIPVSSTGNLEISS